MKRLFPVMAIAILALAVMIVLSSCRRQASSQNEGYFPEGTANTKVATTTSAAPAEEELAWPDPNTNGKKDYPPPTKADMEAAKAAGIQHAVIKTVKGNIVVELNGTEAPLTVANFVKLTKEKFYDGLTFHRVEPGFVIQGGDPNGDGSGGPGYRIKREISPKLRHIDGALAMARSSDPDSAGSQFYITLAETQALDDQYAVFGKVIKGMDVVKKIAIGDKITSIRLQ